jgi:hypothetical protein
MMLDRPFERGLIDRLSTQYGYVDVHALAAQVQDMIRRGKTVRNRNALLVSLVVKASGKVSTATGSAVDPEDLPRYARFYVALYWAIAVEGLGPREVAQRLAIARGNGFPRLNPLVCAELAELGATWPRGRPC